MKQHLSLFIQCKSLNKRILYFLFVITVLIGSPFVWGADYDVMLDASGSMRGFKTEADTWQNLLTRVESSARNKYQFGDKNNFKRVKGTSLFNVRLRDQETYLGEALQDWLNESAPGDVVVILTDNVADIRSRGGSSESQLLFYDLLSKPDSPFSHIAIFPMMLPFNGKVFPIGRGVGKKYQGPRALSIYAIARDFYDDAFDKLRSQIKTKLEGFDYQYIQIKPFDSESVSGLVKDIKIIDLNDTNGASVIFEKDEDGIERLVVSNLFLGEEIKFSFNVNIQSSNSFELQDVELLADIQLFTDDEPLKQFKMTDNFSADVNPRRATISPEGFQDIRVIFQNEPFYFRDLSFLEKLVFTIQNTMIIRGNLDLQFKASREDMNLSQGILQTWSYEGAAGNLVEPKAEVQQKVYKLGDLVKSMLPENNELQKLYSVPLILELRFPIWPLLVVILAVIVVIFVILYLVSAGTPKEYILEDEMGHSTEVAMGFGQPYRHYLGNGQLMFSLSAWGIGFFVSSPFRLLSSRLIGGGQYIKIFDSETDDEYSWQLLEVTRIKYSKSDDDDDFF